MEKRGKIKVINEEKKAIILLDQGCQNKGTVVNIIICNENGIKGLILSNDQTLWDCSNYVVELGDKWEDGIFSKPEGEPCDRYESPEQQQINSLQEEKEKIKAEMITKSELETAYAEGVNEI